MAETYPSDAELLALASDPETGVEYIETGKTPYFLEFRKLLYRLLQATRRGNDGRVHDTSGLAIGVKPCTFLNGQMLVSFAGAASQCLSDNATNYVYLTAAGVLTVSTSGYPSFTTPHLRLATVIASAGDIQLITDDRGAHLWLLGGSFLPLAGGAMAGNLTLNGAADALGSAAVSDVTSVNADAAYGTEERDLLNELKAKVNSLLAKLRKTTGCGVLAD